MNNEDRKERVNVKYCTFHINKYTKEVMSYYENHFIERKAPGVIFAAKLPDTAITMYKSGKLMFQGEELSEKLRAGEI